MVDGENYTDDEDDELDDSDSHDDDDDEMNVSVKLQVPRKKPNKNKLKMAKVKFRGEINKGKIKNFIINNNKKFNQVKTATGTTTNKKMGKQNRDRNNVRYT